MGNQVFVQVQEWQDVLLGSANEFLASIAEFLPSLVGAIIIFLIGLFISRLLKRLAIALASRFRLPRVVSESLPDMEEVDIDDVDYTELFGSAVYWTSMLVVLVVIADILHLEVVVDALSSLLSYVPRLIAAVIVMIFAIVIANLIRQVVKNTLTQMGVDYVSLISRVVYILILLFGVLIAVEQVGINVTLITANITIIVAGIVLAGAIAAGWGGKDTMSNLISGYFLKKEVQVGDKVLVGTEEGTVESMNYTTVKVKTGKSSRIMANSDLINKKQS